MTTTCSPPGQTRTPDRTAGAIPVPDDIARVLAARPSRHRRAFRRESVRRSGAEDTSLTSWRDMPDQPRLAPSADRATSAALGMSLQHFQRHVPPHFCLVDCIRTAAACMQSAELAARDGTSKASRDYQSRRSEHHDWKEHEGPLPEGSSPAVRRALRRTSCERALELQTQLLQRRLGPRTPATISGRNECRRLKELHTTRVLDLARGSNKRATRR